MVNILQNKIGNLLWIVDIQFGNSRFLLPFAIMSNGDDMSGIGVQQGFADSSAVKLDLGSTSMVISASNPDVGEATDEIGIYYSVEPMDTQMPIMPVPTQMDKHQLESLRACLRQNHPSVWV